MPFLALLVHLGTFPDQGTDISALEMCKRYRNIVNNNCSRISRCRIARKRQIFLLKKDHLLVLLHSLPTYHPAIHPLSARLPQAPQVPKMEPHSDPQEPTNSPSSHADPPDFIPVIQGTFERQSSNLHHGFIIRVEGRVKYSRQDLHTCNHSLRSQVHFATTPFAGSPFPHLSSLADCYQTPLRLAKYDQCPESRRRAEHRSHGQKTPEFFPAVGEAG
jgi:hypothetical protein